jgi:hypothetical protein
VCVNHIIRDESGGLPDEGTPVRLVVSGDKSALHALHSNARIHRVSVRLRVRWTTRARHTALKLPRFALHQLALRTRTRIHRA